MGKKNESNKSNNINTIVNNYIVLNKWSGPPGDDHKFISYKGDNVPLFDVSDRIKDMREASIVHKKVRKYIQEYIKPGMTYTEICEALENKTRELFGKDDMSKGIGFPTGFSINNIAAHDSANPNDTRKLTVNDVVKIDFGTHVNGNIIDSAFTVAYDPIFEPLLLSTQDGTQTGIKMAGPDARIYEISQSIQEAIESYELELNGKVYPIKAVANLGGHTIEPYTIHAGKLVLCAPCKEIENMKMEIGECYAIETFATTGETGSVVYDMNMEANHFALNKNHEYVNFALSTTKKLYAYINKTRGSLPFCTRWLDKGFGKGYSLGLKELINKNVVTAYPPLVDKKGTYTSQWEHTIYLHENCKEILSYGDDY